MSKKIIKGIGIGIALYAAFGIGVVLYYPDKPEQMGWEDRQVFNQVQIDKLGSSKDFSKVTHNEIIKMLGGPDISEAKISGENKLQVMYYRTHHERADGITSQDECTPLLFKNDKLIAMGEKAEYKYNNEYWWQQQYAYSGNRS